MTDRIVLPSFNSENLLGKERISQLDIEKIASDSYEIGYSSGWEDANAAESEAKTRVSAELERNLNSISMAFNETADLLVDDLKNFVNVVLTKFIIPASEYMIVKTIEEELLSRYTKYASSKIQIVCSSDCEKTIKRLAKFPSEANIELVVDANLSKYQVHISSNRNEVEIDLSNALAIIENWFELRSSKRTLHHADQRRE